MDTLTLRNFLVPFEFGLRSIPYGIFHKNDFFFEVIIPNQLSTFEQHQQISMDCVGLQIDFSSFDDLSNCDRGKRLFACSTKNKDR